MVVGMLITIKGVTAGVSVFGIGPSLGLVAGLIALVAARTVSGRERLVHIRVSWQVRAAAIACLWQQLLQPNFLVNKSPQSSNSIPLTFPLSGTQDYVMVVSVTMCTFGQRVGEWLNRALMVSLGYAQLLDCTLSSFKAHSSCCLQL